MKNICFAFFLILSIGFGFGCGSNESTGDNYSTPTEKIGSGTGDDILTEEQDATEVENRDTTTVVR